jgi:hypothetical protein
MLPGLQCFWSIISMLGLLRFAVVRKLNQEPPKQPFVSMLIPIAHEIARMSEEKGRRGRTRGRR